MAKGKATAETPADKKGTKVIDATDADAPATPAANVQYIVTIRPGSAAEKPLRFALPGNYLQRNVEDVVQYGIENPGNTRAAQDIAATIQREMGKDYGITANDNAVSKTTGVGGLFTDRTAPDGKTMYKGVDFTVASKQTGGSIDSVVDLYR